MADFGLLRSFGIDNGELDGLRPNLIFVLGYECAMVDEELRTGKLIVRPIHAENRQRIEDECKRLGRICTMTWIVGDVSESWVQMVVNPKDGA